MLTSLYEHLTGIYPHLTPSERNPLASVGFFACENINENSLLEQNIHQYIKLGLYELTGLNWVDFNKLPSEVTRMIIQAVIKKSQNKNEIMDEVEQEFKKINK